MVFKKLSMNSLKKANEYKFKAPTSSHIGINNLERLFNTPSGKKTFYFRSFNP